jgi:DNA-directed RNA polymerase specialized sigma subunit
MAAKESTKADKKETTIEKKKASTTTFLALNDFQHRSKQKRIQTLNQKTKQIYFLFFSKNMHKL